MHAVDEGHLVLFAVGIIGELMAQGGLVGCEFFEVLTADAERFNTYNIHLS